MLVSIISLIFFCGCTEAGNADTDTTVADAAHSSKTEPDYSTVFPDDKVQVINIEISPENWQLMLDNMTEIYGEFGSSSSGGTPGMDMQAGFPGNGEEPEEDNRWEVPNEPDGGNNGVMADEENPVYVPSDITFNGEEWEDVGIRFKGQMSLGSSWREGTYKISFKLNFDKFEDENPDIKNQRFYGFDELNLQSCYGDDSLMRDMIVPTIFRDSGVVAAHTAFYRIYVDYGEGPVYFGLYTMIEAVEDTIIETQFEDDSGNVYKPQGNGAKFAEGTFDTSAFEKKTNEDEEDWSDVESLYEILNSGLRTSDPEEWRSELESVFDVDEFLRWLATNTVIQNWDSYGGNCRNFYLYADPSDGKISWIPWDNSYALNNSMSMGGGGRDDGGFDGGFQEREMPENFGFNATGEMAPERMRTDGNSPDGFMFNNSVGMPAGMPQGEEGFDPGNMDGGNGGGFEQGGFGGGMSKGLSLSLEDVSDEWPLIRYLADDPVYYAKYLEYLEMVATDSFEPEKMEELYRYYHSMIEPYVTGEEGEIEGYTHLNDPEDFNDSLDELIEQVNSRHDAVMEFLAEQ